MIDSASQRMRPCREMDKVRIQSVNRTSEWSAFNDLPGQNSNSDQCEATYRCKLASWEDLTD